MQPLDKLICCKFKPLTGIGDCEFGEQIELSSCQISSSEVESFDTGASQASDATRSASSDGECSDQTEEVKISTPKEVLSSEEALAYFGGQFEQGAAEPDNDFEAFEADCEEVDQDVGSDWLIILHLNRSPDDVSPWNVCRL